MLVELPTGKVLAQTQWRLHDRGQYLWSLGHGRFLLRVRDRLTVIAPMAGGGWREGCVSRGSAAAHRAAHCGVAGVGERGPVDGGDDQPAAGAGRATGGAGSDGETIRAGGPAPVQIEFLPVDETGAGAEGCWLTPAGAIRARTAVALPMTTAGFLDVIEGGKDSWLFNFDEHAGKVRRAGGVGHDVLSAGDVCGAQRVCGLRMQGKRRRGRTLAGFNLKGDEMWQQNFTRHA